MNRPITNHHLFFRVLLSQPQPSVAITLGCAFALVYVLFSATVVILGTQETLTFNQPVCYTDNMKRRWMNWTRIMLSALLCGRSRTWYQYTDSSHKHPGLLLFTFSLTMRLYAFLLQNHLPKIEYYSRFSPSPLSIKQFLEFGKSERILHLKTDRRWQPCNNAALVCLLSRHNSTDITAMLLVFCSDSKCDQWFDLVINNRINMNNTNKTFFCVLLK